MDKHGVKWKKIYNSEPVQTVAEDGEVRIKFLQLKEKLGVADSRFPYPVMVKVICGDKAFLIMESIYNIHSGSVEKMYGDEIRSDVVFLPEINSKNKNVLLDIVKSARPGLIVCGKCREEIEAEKPGVEIRETQTEGVVSVFTDGEKITKIKSFLLKKGGKLRATTELQARGICLPEDSQLFLQSRVMFQPRICQPL